jgi:hypothetical protein
MSCVAQVSKPALRINDRRYARLQLIFAFGVKQLVGAIVIGFGHEHFRDAIQIFVICLRGVLKFLRRDDAVLFEHDDEHFGVDDGAGVKQFHERKLTTACPAEASEGGMNADGRGFLIKAWQGG